MPCLHHAVVCVVRHAVSPLLFATRTYNTRATPSITLHTICRPFIFDSKAMEEPLNTENPRDFKQASIDERYIIVRLRSGQRAIARDERGNECVLEYDAQSPDNNTYHFSKTFYDFIGLYSRCVYRLPCNPCHHAPCHLPCHLPCNSPGVFTRAFPAPFFAPTVRVGARLLAAP